MKMCETPEASKDFDESGSRAESIIDEALEGAHADERVSNLKISILKKALERINNGIVRTGTNRIGTNLTLVEIKVIAETALASIE